MSRPASRRLEVEVEVEAPPESPELRGCFLRVPAEDEGPADDDLLLRGWVLPEEGPARSVEFVCEGAVIGRTLVDLPRPELAAGQPDLPHAGSCGFEHRLNLRAAHGRLRIEARAVLDPLLRIPIASLSVETPAAAEDELVSVVIPCFRQAHFLPEAIESVLAQDHPNLEVVVVDDGSPDNVGEVAGRYPGVRCLRQLNGGLAAARNAGLREASGEFVLFLDADDRLLPKAVASGLEQLRGDPGAVMSAGTWKLIGEVGEPLPADPPELPGDAYPALLESCFISTPAAVLYRRSLFEEIGGFDPEVSASADYDLYLRAAAGHGVRLHPRPVAEYRRHGSNMTRDPELIMRSELAVLERQAPRVAADPALREALERGLERSRAYHGARLELLRAGETT
ncbi:MAG TPA: glycosyltransferase [Solirubrobacterales bacterium]|nr:glycosyltransferase [Solirubrobacterales bacterium]